MNFINKNKKLMLRLLISVVAISIIYFSVDFSKFLEHLKLVDLAYAPLVLGLLILNYIVSSLRWKALLIYKNSEKVGVGYLTCLYFVGSFFNNIMPTSIGGDAYKVFKLGKKIGSYTNSFSATFMERFTGVLVLLLISLFSLYWVFGVWTVLMFIWVGLALLIGFKVLKVLGGRFKVLKKIYDSLCKYKGKNNVIFWAIMTSLLVQLIAISTQYLVFLALGVQLPIMFALFVIPVITLASFFIPSLNGIGVQDLLYMNIFAFIGVPQELALSASILYHLSRLLVSLIGGVLLSLGKVD